MLYVICTRLHPGHLSIPVGDGSRCSEEIVKNLKLRLSMQFLLLLSVHQSNMYPCIGPDAAHNNKKKMNRNMPVKHKVKLK